MFKVTQEIRVVKGFLRLLHCVSLRGLERAWGIMGNAGGCMMGRWGGGGGGGVGKTYFCFGILAGWPPGHQK